jgi:hypothetical protein
MPTNKKQIFDNIATLTKSIKQEFKKKGVVVPSLDANGDTRIGAYTIVKVDNAYQIKDSRNHVIAGPVNLAQTAILIANDLALGRWPDHDLINNDKWYGFKSFDEQSAKYLAERAAKQHDVDRQDLSLSKAEIAHQQKLYYKRSIVSRFTKLCNLR